MPRLRLEEVWWPIFTLWGRSDRKSMIHRHMELDRPRSDSLDTSLLGMMGGSHLIQQGFQYGALVRKTLTRAPVLWILAIRAGVPKLFPVRAT